MLSNEQLKEKEKKILLVCKEFLNNNGKISIVELSNKTGISKSSIQRYLNDPLIINLMGNDVYDKISNLLQQNKNLGFYKGGYISSRVSIQKKDKLGHFGKIEKLKRINKYSIEVYKDAIKMAYYFINNNCSIGEVAKVYNVSKETVRRNFNEVLKECDKELYNSIKIILDEKDNPIHNEKGHFQGKK